MTTVLAAPSLEEFKQAQNRIAGLVLNSPLIESRHSRSQRLLLKLENLQSIGSFKIRGAINAVMQAPPEQKKEGLLTLSAGNMAQGVAWMARCESLSCHAVIPDTASESKKQALRNYGVTFEEVSPKHWFDMVCHPEQISDRKYLIHPCAQKEVIAGQGSIALEILAKTPGVTDIFVPFGGGGLICGIAAACRALKSSAKVWAVEIEGAAPLQASLEAGQITNIDMQNSFVDGIGAPTVLPSMFPLLQDLVSGSCTVSLKETVQALKLLAEDHKVIAEGAGAAALAAALKYGHDCETAVAVISGGNISGDKLSAVLRGEIP